MYEEFNYVTCYINFELTCAVHKKIYNELSNFMSEEKKTPFEISEQAKKEAKDAFDVFDKDKDGQISPLEFATVMRSLGQNPSKKEIDDLIQSLDKDKNGTINFDEFLQLWAEQLNDGMSEDDIVEAFSVFDKDHTEKILATELVHVLKSIGDPMTQEDIDNLINAAQPDKDGYISYVDFVKRIMNS